MGHKNYKIKHIDMSATSKIISDVSNCKSKYEIHGEDNEIYNVNPGNNRLSIRIFGDKNKVIIKTKRYFIASILMGFSDCPVYDSTIIVDEGTTSNGLSIFMMEDGSKLHIGKDCMFSDGVDIWGSDTHTITDTEGNLLNYGRSIEIGDHCWIGRCCRILKNTRLAPNTIVGLGTIITRKFSEGNCIIAGCPGKIIRHGVNWDRRRPQQYLRETGQTIVSVPKEEIQCDKMGDVVDKAKAYWHLEVTQLPRYKRRLFRMRILSHLLPWYRGGVYKKEKWRLRRLIAKVEDHIKSNQST